MSQKNINQVSLESLSQLDQEMDERIEIKLKDGQFVIQMDKVFRVTKIENMLVDLVKFMQKAYKEIREVDEETIKRFSRINEILILKHFTDVDVPDDELKMIKMCEILIDLELLDEIGQHIPQSEKEKIDRIIGDRLKNMETAKSMFGEMILNDEIKNEDNWNDD